MELSPSPAACGRCLQHGATTAVPSPNGRAACDGLHPSRQAPRHQDQPRGDGLVTVFNPRGARSPPSAASSPLLALHPAPRSSARRGVLCICSSSRGGAALGDTEGLGLTAKEVLRHLVPILVALTAPRPFQYIPRPQP